MNENLASAEPTATIRVDVVSKRFGGVVVADAVSLQLDPGEIVGLIGPNGAGKTSLFNLITGTIAPDAGQIRINGRRVERLPVHRRARFGLARTWQHARPFTSLSLLDNLLIAPRDYPGDGLLRALIADRGLRRAEVAAYRRALELLERVGLAERRAALPSELSYGQQKLLGIARALMNRCDCLLLDEPMAGVEGRTYDRMREIVTAEARRGAAVCIVEHNVSFIRDLCTRAVFMASGRVLASGPVDELMRDRRLTELYFGGAVV
ncbi:MAG: ABC transporter ATP-binding protein [Alphaproteobacteria bacterium]|nr:ABC transporter ATP-binding protein [Alphaproteobacteria bacterium]